MSGFIEDIEFNKGDPNEIFDLIELLGEGSYGAVYKAFYKKDDDNNNNNNNNNDMNNMDAIALKIIPAEEDLKSLKEEITILQKCDCEYIVQFVDCFFADNELWIAMEFCMGGSVSDMIDATKINFTELQIQAVCACVVSGLDYLHTKHKIHRDLKAGNILLSSDGKAKLADFGVSAQLNNTLSKRKTIIGTPFWMAPEVIQETDYDGKADIWSLGITAIEMAEGQPPHFKVHPMRAIFMIPMKPAPTLTEQEKWGSEFNDFLACCLTKDPYKRSSSKDLLTHVFIKSLIEMLNKNPTLGLPAIKDLVEFNMEEIQKYRQPGSDSENDDNDSQNDATMKPGQVVGNNNNINNKNGSSTPPRNGNGNGGHKKKTSRNNNSIKNDDGTIRRAGKFQSKLSMREDGTMVRGGHNNNNNRPHSRNYSRGSSTASCDNSDSGTMVRHVKKPSSAQAHPQRPHSRIISKVSDIGGDDDDDDDQSGTRVFYDPSTAKKGEQNAGLQSALKYFQGVSISDETKEPNEISNNNNNNNNSSSVVGKEDNDDIDPYATLVVQRKEFKDHNVSKSSEEIRQQLTSLDLQYKNDLDMLRVSYEKRKQQLSAALHSSTIGKA